MNITLPVGPWQWVILGWALAVTPSQDTVLGGWHPHHDVRDDHRLAVRAPRVNDKRVDESTGQRKRFSSEILPAWSRKSPRVAEVLPLLYLHGLSSSDFGPALAQFLGSGAGLSAATITRLTTQWQEEAAVFGTRSLAGTDYVYVWVDGIHLKVRLQQDKVCLLVMIGVRADGHKELIALADGFRESSESTAPAAVVTSRSAWCPYRELPQPRIGHRRRPRPGQRHLLPRPGLARMPHRAGGLPRPRCRGRRRAATPSTNDPHRPAPRLGPGKYARQQRIVGAAPRS